MYDTIVTRRNMESQRNIAAGYMKLQDYTFSEVETESQTDDAHASSTTIVAIANEWISETRQTGSVKILAQTLFKTLFKTTPPIDINALATKEADLWVTWYGMNMIELLTDRSRLPKEVELTEYFGEHEGLITTVGIFLDPYTAYLPMVMNSCEDSQLDLKFYELGTYSFMPLTKHEWLQSCVCDWDETYMGLNENELLYFHREDDGKVSSFSWK
ncbi:hypothetical protein Daus18300_014550 [Diaporthe australafricana]|uniref:Uncharacterized protein n=1 Tax=Diaporthe australafricana TaxID=127596 RepID=A0ABR3VUR5_9PEZI